VVDPHAQCPDEDIGSGNEKGDTRAIDMSLHCRVVVHMCECDESTQREESILDQEASKHSSRFQVDTDSSLGL
jgi:hypothetical protein